MKRRKKSAVVERRSSALSDHPVIEIETVGGGKLPIPTHAAGKYLAKAIAGAEMLGLGLSVRLTTYNLKQHDAALVGAALRRKGKPRNISPKLRAKMRARMRGPEGKRIRSLIKRSKQAAHPQPAQS